MNILMTGITSFLGSHTAAHLIREGHSVTGIIRPGSQKEDVVRKVCPGAQILTLKLEELSPENPEDFLERLPRENRQVDVCIHFAWDGPGSAARENYEIQHGNVGLSQNIFLLSRAIGCRRFVFSGSQAEYGRGSKDDPKPVSEYGKAKLEFGTWAEQEALSDSRMQFVHMRIYSVYGEGDHETSLVHTLIRTCMNGEILNMSSCGQMWNYLEVRDCAAAVSLMAVSPEVCSGVYDIGGEEIRPLKEYVLEIGRICGGEDCYRLGARPDNAEGAADLIPDIKKLQALGFHSQISFREGIGQLYQSMKTKERRENQ